ncbi:MAG: type II toxin-antitoxin system RelE/ParE family toxin [Betaproteobacteria bacterium]|nr:type II toxin-antitoxin system RelE/ParE family toxin [Betaproteobacteria bacterium]
MISYSFHPEAEAELEDASLFYESRMPGLGKSFAAEVERTIYLIREFPDAGSPTGPMRRRVLVARFPYSVVYRRDPDFVVIIAIAHQRRRPGYWRQRK